MDGNSVYNDVGYDQPTASTCDSSFCCFFCDGVVTALCGISDSIGIVIVIVLARGEWVFKGSSYRQVVLSWYLSSDSRFM